MKYTYTTSEGGKEYRIDLKTDWGEDSPGFIAEDAAKDYYNNHDGWDSSWPMEIEVFSGDRSLGRFNVDLKFDPNFYAEELVP